MKPKSSGGLAYITTKETPEQQPNIILNKDELDKTLLNYSRRHFATAQGSPFTIEPLSRLLHYDGLTPFGNRIFDGRNTFDHLQLDEPTRTLLKHLKNKTASEAIRQHPLDYESLMNGIKKWPEKTTSGIPTQRSYGC